MSTTTRPPAAEVSFWNRSKPADILAAADLLQDLIPVQGSVPNAKQNPALEDFRKLCHLYYEIYNNGGCNWANGYGPTLKQLSIRYVYGPVGMHLVKSDVCPPHGTPLRDRHMDCLEELADAVFAAACKEQGIDL